MASLQQVTSVSRRILGIGILVIVGIFLLTTLINIFHSLHPSLPPPPTVGFGKLPPILFPNAAFQTFTYSLQTVSGGLPDLGDRATVYKMQPLQPDLLALSNATALVQKLGYTGSPTKISDSLYQWTNTDALPKTLLMNIFTNNFAITSNYASDQNVLQATNLPDENGAVETAMTYLQNASLLPSDINTSKTQTTLLSISNGQLIPASSLSSAQVIQVDLFQNDINNLSIFYPQPGHSTMQFFVAGGNDVPQIITANFNHQSIGSDKTTYPILTSQQAFDALKKGQAYIASYDGTGTSISITTVELGYYMSDQDQQYLMPIIVFEGNHGFVAYVSAIQSNWINQ